MVFKSGRKDTFDYVIVGGGTAGCLLANRLSEDPRNEVALIEAGGKDNYLWVKIPVGYLYCIGNPRTDWLFRTRSEQSLNGRSLLYPRGRILGGSSSINGMIYMRGQAADYDRWVEATGDNAWAWDYVLPYFKRHESHHGGTTEFHNGAGEWRVEKQRLSWQLLDRFAVAANEQGIPSTDDFNRGNNFGVGYFEVNQRSGFRCSASVAFLRPALGRENLTVMTQSQAKKLLFKEGAADPVCTGVSFDRLGINEKVFARKEVILTAGAVGSPQILELSGIGQKKHLEKLRIPVVHDLPGVGENMQDHLQLRMIFKVDGVKTLNTMVSTPMGKAKIALEYAFKRTGPMSMAPSQLGAFAKSNEREVLPNLQYHVQPLSLEKFGEPLHSFNAFTASVCNLRPTSRGNIHIQSRDYKQAPMISPNYLATAEDKQVAVESLQLTRQIVAQSALAEFQPKEYLPGASLQSEKELVKAAGEIGTTIFHPVGTCRMGKDEDTLAVVDKFLRVRGVGHLRVVDASVMPTITSGNTCSPTLMIAERAASMILNP
ncbi:MAG: GMC family oxidoreductase N-terminal domain-containing protein [Burkholderiales bacterium]|nr:GMC family oxidoreductase N-terminal domain-containing protein [Burkholderiales bacterium]